MKDFLLIGPAFTTTYPDIVNLFKTKTIRGGYHTVYFYFDNNNNTIRAGECFWLTTLNTNREGKTLTNTYSKDKYPAYDNYPQAINVDYIKDIPTDYEGVMGVPITWLDGYYDGYEIVGLNNDSRTNDFKYLIKGTPLPDKNGVPRFGFFCKGKQVYTRILIRRKQDD